MFESLSLIQNTFVDNAWGFILAITGIVSVASGIALFWIMKVRNYLANNPAPNADWDEKGVALIDKILPILKQGQQLAETTAKQEVKAKQFGEILYDLMGDKANEIKDKYEVKLVNLTADVQKATEGTAEYNEKLKQLEQLLEEIKGSSAGAPVK